MKMMKKIAVVMLSICLLLPCFSLVSLAANDGKIMFTDHNNPSVQTGSLVKVKGVVQKSQGNFGKISITMTYDTSYLNFKSGDNVSKVENGKLQYSGDGTNVTGNRIEFYMTFEALKAGTTTLKIQSATVKSVSGSVLDYEKGSSIIAIEGESVTPSDNATTTEKTEEIDGVTYRVASEVPENEIPEGYEPKMHGEYAAVYNAEKDLYLVYMIDEEQVGQLFMLDKEKAVFVPYEEIKISSQASIILLSDVSGVTMPKSYKKTEVTTVSGKKYPAWSNADMPGFVVLYALDSAGTKAFYRMDVEELTYQKFEVVAEQEEEETSKGFIDKLNAKVQGHLDYFVYGAGVALLIFVVIIVILGIKLFNRNAELDELYEQYGDDQGDFKKREKSYDEEDDYDELAEYDKYDLPEDSSSNIFLQEGMKELFPDAVEEEGEVEAEVPEFKIPVKPVEKVGPKMEEQEDTLGAILAKQKQEESSIFDDDDTFDNFSLDFIDLDD